MIKPDDPRQLAVDLLSRSICNVKVAAVIADDHGIFSWGWNNSGDGFGLHAEDHVIRRANKKRIVWATLYVAGERARNHKPVPSRPCGACESVIKAWGIRTVWYRDGDGKWVKEDWL